MCVYTGTCKYGYIHVQQTCGGQRTSLAISPDLSPFLRESPVQHCIWLAGWLALELLEILPYPSPISQQEHWDYSCMRVHPAFCAFWDSNSVPHACATSTYPLSPFSSHIYCHCIIKCVIRCCMSSWKNISSFLSR